MFIKVAKYFFIEMSLGEKKVECISSHKSSFATPNKPGMAQIGAMSSAQQIVKLLGGIQKWGKIKALYPNFEYVISDFWKRYIRTLKTLYPNF